MSALPQVSPDWLLLRADADYRSRSSELVHDVSALLPSGHQEIHDLGSGSGAMMRWLAPRLSSPQRWVLHDADATILEHRDPAPVLDGLGVTVVSRESVEALADLRPSVLAGATLVVASALLDVITFAEAHAIVDACELLRVPVLFSLTVTGRVEFDPVDRMDAKFEDAFNAHQRRDADGRRLLGPDAGGVVASMFLDAEWRVRTERTPWKLGPRDGDLIAEWLDGWMGAAVEQRRDLGVLADDYLVRRRAQLAAGELRVTVDHEDVLAWPA